VPARHITGSSNAGQLITVSMVKDKYRFKISQHKNVTSHALFGLSAHYWFGFISKSGPSIIQPLRRN
jgi:hypothetical protein